jgi:hypothetical protein
VGHVARRRGETKRRRPRGRPGHRCVVNIRMNLGEMECKVMDWMHVGQDRDRRRALVNKA